MERVICLAIGYVFGLFQTSYIYGKMHGIDIREHGSGNAGTTNALRTLGTKAGLITFAGDCLKCIAAVLVVNLLYRSGHPDHIKLFGLYAAAGTILGHNFPFYLGFRGGKGIAATAGLIASFDLRIGVVALSAFIIVFLVTHYVSLGSIVVYIVLMSGTLLLGQMGRINVTADCLYELYGVVAFLTVMALYRHRANIGRLLHGNENKTYLKKKK